MTLILKADDPTSAHKAAEYLAQGKLIILPTDTVYGIAAALRNDAIVMLYEAKTRPPDKAIPVLLASKADVSMVALTPTVYEQKLINAYWPGPLTLILRKNPNLPHYVSQTDTVGVRVPDNAVARSIIKAAGGALGVSSANRSGFPPAQDIEMALRHLGDYVELAIDDGLADGRAASTVAQLDGNVITVVRAGPITKAQLEHVIQQS